MMIKAGYFLVLNVVLFVTVSWGQDGNNYEENVHRIDNFINGPIRQTSCPDGWKFPALYKTRMLKRDLQNLIKVEKSAGPDANAFLLTARLGVKSQIFISNGLLTTQRFTVRGKYLK